MRAYVITFFCIIGILAGWKGNIIEKKLDAYSAETFEQEKQEENSMKREFCEVVEEDNEFILKNTKGERYLLDLSFNQDFKKGDNVLLIYTERRQIENNTYEADVYAIYPENFELQMPAK